MRSAVVEYGSSDHVVHNALKRKYFFSSHGQVGTLPAVNTTISHLRKNQQRLKSSQLRLHVHCSESTREGKFVFPTGHPALGTFVPPDLLLREFNLKFDTCVDTLASRFVEVSDDFVACCFASRSLHDSLITNTGSESSRVFFESYSFHFSYVVELCSLNNVDRCSIQVKLESEFDQPFEIVQPTPYHIASAPADCATGSASYLTSL